MLPTVPETTQSVGSIARIGTSLAGSGMLGLLAVGCLVFGTGMGPVSDTATTGSASAVVSGEASSPDLPAVKRVRWIKNIVEEPMPARRISTDRFESASPLGIAAAMVTG